MPPCRLKRRKLWKFDYEMVHSEVLKNALFVCFRSLIFHPFFQGVSWPHLPLCADAHASAFTRWGITSPGSYCGGAGRDASGNGRRTNEQYWVAWAEVKTAVNDGIDGQSVSIWGIHAFPRRLAMGGSKPTSQPGARFTEYLTAILRLSLTITPKLRSTYDGYV